MKGTWLVTGSAGFIGSNLCEALLKRDFNVYGLDNFSTGKHQNLERIRKINKGSFNFVEGDILNFDLVCNLCTKVDMVVHLAAQGSVQKSFANIKYNNAQNIDGFVNLLTASGATGVKKFVYASSCSVYGNAKKLPISESECPAPTSPYATSKLTNDLIASNLSDVFPEMSVTGLRFFNIYGPFQDPNGDYAAVIPKWIDACLRGEQPVIFGDGKASRDFCYVGDVCETIINLFLTDRRSNKGVFNIGSGASTSLEELYNIVSASLVEKGVQLSHKSPNYLPWRDGDILHSLGDISLAKKTIGFNANVDLYNGVSKILSVQYGI